MFSLFFLMTVSDLARKNQEQIESQHNHVYTTHLLLFL